MEFRFLDNYETSVDARKTELIKKNKISEEVYSLLVHI